MSADDDAAKLKRLRGRIQTLQTELNKTVHKRDSEREEVQQLENRIGSRIRTLRQLDPRLKIEAKRLRDLQRQRTIAQNDLGNQTKGLEAQVKAEVAAPRGGVPQAQRQLQSAEETLGGVRLVGSHRHPGMADHEANPLVVHRQQLGAGQEQAASPQAQAAARLAPRQRQTGREGNEEQVEQPNPQAGETNASQGREQPGAAGGLALVPDQLVPHP